MLQKLWCFLGMHEWTCDADQQIPPTKKQINNGMDGYWDYAKMYCKHCKTESELNIRNK